MANLQFEILDWVDPGGAKGEELRSTWGRLRILVGDLCATRVVSGRAGGARDHVYAPLYPVAEWLAAHWWFLGSEVKTPRRDYERRHALRFAAEGFALPNLSIHPLGNVTEIDVTKRLLHHQELEFLTEGRVFIRSDNVMRSIRSFVESVLDRLDDLGVGRTPLHEEWDSVQAIERDASERLFCELCAGLGVDPLAVPDEIALSLQKWAPRFDDRSFREICAALSASNVESGFGWMEKVSSMMKEQDSPWTKLPKIKKSLMIKGTADFELAEPWIEGYSKAKRLRKQLKLNGHLFKSFGDVASILDVNNDASKAITYKKSSVTAFDGVVQLSKNGAPAFVTTKLKDPSVKFAFVRSLYDYLHMGGGDLAVTTRAHSQSQQASRAFAAEFLAPADLLRNKIDSDFLGWEEISELAQHFGVAELVVRHQIVNHRLADVIDDQPR